jgi:anti-sigma-K factor RskA
MTDRSLHERIDEVVVGLASEAEVAEMEALCAADPDVASQVERARRRYVALDYTADNLPLPADLWTRIEASLDSEQERQVEAGTSAEIFPLDPRNTQGRWRAAAFGSAIAAAVLAVALGFSLTMAPEPTVIAVLLDSQGQPIAVVEGAENNQTLITLLENTRVPANSVMQVWTKPDENGPPVSLGLLAAARSRTLTATGLPPPRAEQLYEITFEPTGGSPTNLPTGPILGKGFAKEPVY